MPILTTRPKPLPIQTGTIQKTQLPVIADPEYRAATVDTRYLNHRHLLTRIAGSSWTTRYYQQVLGKDNELTPQQLSKDAVYQQYIEINELELRVNTPLSSSQTVETREFQVTGGATVYPPMVPNVGDMFLADIGDGREGIFAVTTTNRMSILTDTCYELEYLLISEANDEHKRDLTRKTIKHTHFVKSIVENGGNPFLATEEYDAYRNIAQVEQRLLGHYFGTFFNKKVSSLAVPDQVELTYDPWLVKFLQQLLDTTLHPILRVLKLYSAQIPEETPPVTLWDALIKSDIDRLPLCNEKLALVDARLFGTSPQFEGVFFSNIDDVVYPVDRHSELLFTNLLPGQLPSRDIRHQFKTTRLGNPALLTRPTGVGLASLYPIHPVTKDDYYVFTEAFYFNYGKEQSQLEVLTHNAMEGKEVDREVLLQLCEAMPRWGRLEQFYYTPVLLALLKVAKQNY
jgi:hypothetical protein